MSSARTALRERVAALGRARRAFDAGRLDDAERVLQDELARWPGNRDAQALLAEITRARGATPGHQGEEARPATKPGGDAWSSFEQRIRDRKAARLQARIRSSLAAGSPVAVLESLEELESIAPGVPLPNDIVERLRAQHLERPVRQERPRPQSPIPTKATASPLDLFPPATVDPAPEVDHAAPAFQELPIRPPEPAPLDVRLDAEPAPAQDDGAIRLRLAPAVDIKPERSAPLRERSAHLLGLLLLVSSIVALSAWAGYELFRPGAVTDTATTVAQSTGEETVAAPPADPAPTPQVSEARENNPAVDAGTTGTAGGGTGATPAGTEPIVPPATPPGVTAAPTVPASTPSTSSTDRSIDARQSVTREPTTPSAASERPPSPTPLPSVPAETRPPAEPVTELPSVSGSTSAPQPAIRTAQPTPEPIPPIAQNRSEPAAPVSPPASPATGREPAVAAESASGASDAGSAATADAGTSTRDADAMRGLIEGYLAGYNNLDAGGVRAVWPAVDQRALARAFGQLRSQHLSFSRCEVRTTGGAGHGFCTGHAAWRPRVGSGERIEQRVWRFDFAQRDDEWIIQRVNVER